jgi:signal transduction histidine kinase
MLPLAAGLALAYHLLLVVFDQWVFPWPALPPGYYVLNCGMALLALGLTAARTSERVVRATLPFVIVLLAMVPLLTTYLLVPPDQQAVRPLGVAFAAGGLTVRILPVLLLTLVLTAWYYRWPQVLIYNLGTAGVQIGLLLFVSSTAATASTESLLNSLVVIQLVVLAVQTVSLVIIGLFISTLMHRLRAQQAALDAANQQLRRYAVTLESLTVSRERNRMARELHDTLAHTLSGLSVQLETVNAYWEVDPAAARTLLHEAQEIAHSGLHETRQALSALRASPLDDLGLGLALRQLAVAAAARVRLQLDLSLPDPLPPLSPDLEQGLYRVAQEAITNVVNHARARCLAITLICRPGETRLVIRDDGIGFDPARPHPPGHFGLDGIRERAQLIGGHLTVTSRPGGGTTVDLRVGGPAGYVTPLSEGALPPL